MQKLVDTVTQEENKLKRARLLAGKIGTSLNDAKTVVTNTHSLAELSASDKRKFFTDHYSLFFQVFYDSFSFHDVAFKQSAYPRLPD